MKKISCLTMGIVALLLPLQMAVAASSSSAPATLYDRMKDGVERDLEADTVEPEIAEYVKGYMKTRKIDISIEDVTAAIKNHIWTLCGTRNINDIWRSFGACGELTANIQRMVERESRIRHLARDLQLTATSFELPISDLPGRSLQISTDLHAIVSIWSADTRALSSASSSSSNQPAPIRTVPVDVDVMRPLLQTLGTDLKNLPSEELTAAVWRYQYGTRFIKGDRAPDYPTPYKDTQSGPGTERQYLFKQWSNIEKDLMDMWAKVEKNTFTPALSDTESVLYTFPPDLFKNYLPDNVIVWIRLDKKTNHPLGDIGLQWSIPTEPVLPSLFDKTNDTIILGGNYPPEPVQITSGKTVPVDGQGLCTSPGALRGYLCRPFSPATGERCPDDPADKPDPTKISLITCQDTTDVRTTMSGPDVCRDIDIRSDHTFDANRECTIVFRCGNKCGEGFSGGVQATTGIKQGNGAIEICIDSNLKGKGMTPLLYHELVHAYQQCTFPPGFNPYDKAGKTLEQQTAICCELEGGGYRAQCDMAEEDGAFEGKPTFKDPVTGQEIPINAETCAEATANLACAPDGYQKTLGCYQSRTYPKGFTDAVFDKIANNPKVTAVDCATAKDPKTMDPRVRDLIDAVEHRRDVCGPGQTEVYKNTIGNNMCYIGQCVEESVELHRLTGAQSPATVGDESFPYHDPQTGSPLGNALLNPPISSTQLPIYRPQQIVNQLEAELCQLQGLPPLTPSILCSYSPATRLEHPLIDPISNAESLLVNIQVQRETTNRTLSLALGLGARLGTTMYAEYLHSASRSLADVLGIAVKLFKEISVIDFPTVMCPIDGTLPPAASAS